MLKLTLFISILTSCLSACTAFLLKSIDGSVVYCRSMEFGLGLESDVLVTPKGVQFTGTTPQGGGFTWQTKYGIVGLNQNLDRKIVSDGINEKGLVASILYLPNFAKCEPFDLNKIKKTIGSWELPMVVLSLCSTVEEAKKLIPTLVVAEQNFPGMGDFALPLHLYVADKTGAVLIVEFVDGKRHMYDHPLGTLTNAPPLSWQMINLGNYINLSPYNAPNLNLKNSLIKGFGQGSGMLGLPGDWTPPSRFVRASLFSSWANPLPTSAETAELGFHILNTFDIFSGLILNHKKSSEKNTFDEITQWAVVHDLANLCTYVRTYESQQIEKIDLKKIDFSRSNQMQIRLKKNFSVVDITDRQTPLPKDLE